MVRLGRIKMLNFTLTQCKDVFELDPEALLNFRNTKNRTPMDFSVDLKFTRQLNEIVGNLKPDMKKTAAFSALDSTPEKQPRQDVSYLEATKKNFKGQDFNNFVEDF